MMPVAEETNGIIIACDGFDPGREKEYGGMVMSDLTHLFKVGQKAKCRIDERFYDGTVKEIYEDHIIVGIPKISDHCWFEQGFNMDCVYPEYN